MKPPKRHKRTISISDNSNSAQRTLLDSELPLVAACLTENRELACATGSQRKTRMEMDRHWNEGKSVSVASMVADFEPKRLISDEKDHVEQHSLLQSCATCLCNATSQTQTGRNLRRLDGHLVTLDVNIQRQSCKESQTKQLSQIHYLAGISNEEREVGLISSVKSSLFHWTNGYRHSWLRCYHHWCWIWYVLSHSSSR